MAHQLTYTKSQSVFLPQNLGISYIQNYFDPRQLNFGVRTINFPAHFTAVFLISAQASWASVHIHYLSTSREDIRVGNFIADNPQLLTPTGSNVSNNLIISHLFGSRKWNGGSPYVVVYSYLAGVVCDDRFMNIKI